MEAALHKLLALALATIFGALATSALAGERHQGNGVNGAATGPGASSNSTWTTPPGFGEGNKTGWKDEKGVEPPGWDHGNKLGWGGQSLPPGLGRRK